MIQSRSRIIKKLKNCCNDFFFIVLSILTLGSASSILLAAIILLLKLPLTGIDTTILTWLIVGFCISVVVFIYSLSILYWNWKYSKLVFAIIIGLFDIFLLVSAMISFTFKDQTLNRIGKLWCVSPKSSLADYIEKTYQCCGFDETLADNCESINKTNLSETNSELANKYKFPFCKDVLNNKITQSRTIIGVILITIFAILLACDAIAFYQGIHECTIVLEPEFSDIPPNSALSTQNWW